MSWNKCESLIKIAQTRPLSRVLRYTISFLRLSIGRISFAKFLLERTTSIFNVFEYHILRYTSVTFFFRLLLFLLA